MTTDEVMDMIDNHINDMKEQSDHFAAIDRLLGYLNYLRRINMLSDEEMQDFIYCNEGYPLTDKDREMMKKDRGYIDGKARFTYFRRCSWLQYLYGESDEKPSPLNLIQH